MTGLVLDAGAFIGLERRKRHVAALLERARGRSVPMVTSAAVVGQVWRGHASQAPIALAFRWKHLDVVDAHVVVLARERGWPVVTSDPDDLRRLDPKLALHVV